MMGNNLPQLPTLSTTRSLPRDPCRICLCTCRPIPLDGAGYLTYSLLSSQQGRMYYPLINVFITNWKITMLLMGKSTISMAIFNVANCKITGGYRSLGFFRSLLEHTLLFFGSLLPSSRSQTPRARGDRGDRMLKSSRRKILPTIPTSNF